MAGPSEIKSQVNRDREEDDPAAFSDKPMLGENHGAGLRGRDRQQGALRDKDRGAYSQCCEDGGAGERTPHQDAQHGANVRGQPAMVQRDEDLPEGLLRERKGPYDKNFGRKEDATRVPKNWTGND